MRRGFVAVLLTLCVVSGALTGVSEAQTESSSPPAVAAGGGAPAPAVEARDLDAVLANGASEWSIGAGVGLGVGHPSTYAFQTLSWGRVLTGPSGPDLVRGRFEWAVEVTPFFGQFDPDRSWGVGISPLIWRWNFERQGPVAPFAEVGGGGLWTSEPLPAGTVSGNFTVHVTLGIRKLTAARRGLLVAYRYDHISNGNRADRNPGINAHVAYFAWTFLRPSTPQ